MTDPQLEPLDSDLTELLREERARPAAGAAAKARTLARLSQSLGLPPGQLSPPVKHAAPRPPTSAPSPLAASHAAKLGGWALRVPLSLGTFILGGAVGAGAHAVLTRHPTAETRPAPAPATVTVPRLGADAELPAAGGATGPEATPPPAPRTDIAGPEGARPHGSRSEPISPRDSKTAPPPAGEPSPPENLATRDLTLAAERALLETARTALTRGHLEAAQRALADHLRRFSRGALVEEREALQIRAWVAAGSGDEARAAAEAFRSAHPHSFLQPSIDAALRQVDP